MRKATLFIILAILVSGGLAYKSTTGKAQPSPSVAARQPDVSPACTPPAQMASSAEETAWELFVAATCPTGNNQYPYVTWENWIEQQNLYAPGGPVQLQQGVRPRFHMSPLARIMQQRLKKKGAHNLEKLLPQSANENCNSQTWSGRTICEEARLNASAQGYVVSNKLNTKIGQEQFVAAGSTFQFPAPAVEIKADWIQLPSCSNLPQGVHIETISNTCYALGGIHLISKLIDKWLWATFEPQNATTNPQRCKVLGCQDSWGSNPPATNGANTQLSTALAALMQSANLAPEWTNYRLDGVQIDFVDGSGKATILGNSVIEGDNAGNPTLMKSSSCITCHDLSTISAKGQGLSPDFIVGPPQAVPPGYARRDFVWSLALAH